jgi:hypothetical protein
MPNTVFVSRSALFEELCPRTDALANDERLVALSLKLHGCSLVSPVAKHEFGRLGEVSLSAAQYVARPADATPGPRSSGRASDPASKVYSLIRGNVSSVQNAVFRSCVLQDATDADGVSVSAPKRFKGWTGALDTNVFVDRARDEAREDPGGDLELEAAERAMAELQLDELQRSTDRTYYSDEDEANDGETEKVRVRYGNKDEEFLAVVPGDFRSLAIETKLKQFELFISLLDLLPACRGSEESPQSRYLQQRIMHVPMINALAYVVFGSDFQTVLPELKRKYGVYKSNPVIAVKASRQVGKTTALAIFLLAAAIAFPGINIVVASTGQRSANETIERMRSYRVAYELRHGKRFKMIYDGVTTMMFAGNRSRVTAMPASPDRVRGVAPDLFYFDEVSFGDARMLSELAFPLLTINRCLIMTGTPSDSPDNHFTKLINAEWIAGPLIETVDLALVCKTCLYDGVLGTCKHRAYLENESNVSLRQSFIQALITTIATVSVAAAETLGVFVESSSKVFDLKAINRLRTSPAIPTMALQGRDKPTHAIVCVDPSGGGASESSVIAGFSVPSAMRIPYMVVCTYECLSLHLCD